VEDESNLADNCAFAVRSRQLLHEYLSHESFESRSWSSFPRKHIDHAMFWVQYLDTPKLAQPVFASLAKYNYGNRLWIRIRSSEAKTSRTSWNYCTMILNTNELPSLGGMLRYQILKSRGRRR
jgi:hypothetical protein